MDNLAHTLAGAALARAGLRRASGLATATLMIAANIPDVDVIGLLFGENLAWRRGWTHGPLAFVLLPALLAGAMWAWDRWQARRGARPDDRAPVRAGALYALGLLGFASHVGMDWLNTYGIRCLMPFVDRWFYGDTLFIIDVWLWTVLAAGCLWSRRRWKLGLPRPGAPAAAALAAAGLYTALGYAGARRLEGRLEGAGQAARAIMDGDLARRLPATGRGDEFDRLSGTMNLMLARIEALVAAQRQVTDDIAHDLRTPLSRLRQRLEGALARSRDAAADAATLEAALAELDEVLATFAALLRIARAESGAPRAGFAELDLSALLRGVAEAWGPVAEEAGRALDVAVPDGVALRGDAALLRQAVSNLLDNAILHGGARIALRLEEGPRIAVEDDGPGIPEGEREAALRRFHRLDRSRNTPGTGLGLALSAAVARLHGGALRLEGGPSGRGLRAAMDLRPVS